MEFHPRVHQTSSSPAQLPSAASNFGATFPRSSDTRPRSPQAVSTFDTSTSPNYAETPPEGEGYSTPREVSPGVQANPDLLSDLKRPRACEACRQLKVRCDPESGHPNGSCKRCAKANRRCIVTAPTRKRQKKSDSRVAELEKRIDALTESLHESRANNHIPDTFTEPVSSQGLRSGLWRGAFPRPKPTDTQGSGAGDDAASPSSGPPGKKRQLNGDSKPQFRSPAILRPLSERYTEDGPSTAAAGTADAISGGSESVWPSIYDAVPKARDDNEYTDVIDREVIDVETAEKAFKRYTEDMAPLFPFVVFPEGTPMAEVRRTKPILFLTILSVAIPAFRPSLQVSLVNEVHRVLADRIMVRGLKSLELVQALIVGVCWYSPPDHFEEIKFYQFLHLAAVVGMELGMNRRSGGNTALGVWREIIGKRMPQVHPDCLEARRAWAGCYFMGVAASMSLRRPLLTRWSAYMDESLEKLQNSPDALPTDKGVVHWIKLAHIGEEIGFQFSMDDPLTQVSVTDPKVQFTIKSFERQLEDWRKAVPPDAYTTVMEHSENVFNIYMHEIALHVDHKSIDDFRPPFLSDLNETTKGDLGTVAHVEALTACLTSVHRTLDLLCSIDPPNIHDLPTVIFVRSSYAVVALIKLHNASVAPKSNLGQVFSPSDFKIEDYLNKTIQHLTAAAGINSGRAAPKFLLIMKMLRTWFLKNKDGKKSFTVPHFFQPRGECNAPHESDQLSSGTSGGGSKQQNTTAGGPTPLSLLSEVALGDPNEGTQTQTTTAIREFNSHTPSTEPSNSVASSQPASAPANMPVNDSWQQATSRSMISPSMAPDVPAMLDWQQAYAQNQAVIQANTFNNPIQQQQLQPQQQQQVIEFMTDLDMMTAQPDGLALWGNLWDDVFWPLPLDGNAGNL